MHLSIIGSPGCGKTTLFQALSGIAVESRSGSDHIAVIDVPDYRVDELVRIFMPKKTVYTRITLADTVAITEGEIKSDTISAKSLQQMRGSDALSLATGIGVAGTNMGIASLDRAASPSGGSPIRKSSGFGNPPG